MDRSDLREADRASGAADEPRLAPGSSVGEASPHRPAVRDAAEVFFVFGSDDAIRYASPSIERVLGYDPAGVIGETILDYVHPDDAERLMQAHAEVRNDPERKPTVEIRAHHKDGSWRRLEVSSASLLGDASAPGVVSVVRDAASRENTGELFRSVVSNSSEIVKILDPDGTLRYASPAFERVLGYDPGWAVGKNMLDFVHPEDLPRVLRDTEKALEDPGVARNVAEYRFRHADGSWRHIEAAGTYLLDDPTVGGVLVTARDVTERKRAEAQIREAEERYRTLVEHVPAVVYVEAMDGSMTTLYDSPQIEAMLGYPRDTHEKDPDYWKRIIHPDDRERVLSTERAALAVEGPFTVEYRVFASDGRTVWVRDEAVVAQGEGDEPPYWQGFISDITHRKDAELALKESEERYRGQSRELALLHQVRTALAEEVELPNVFRKLVETIAEAYGYTQVSAYLLEGDELVLQHQVGYHRVIDRIPVTDGVSGRAVRAGQPVLLEDVTSDPEFLGAIEGISSEICVPLFDEGEVIGFFNVESTGGVRLTENDLRLMVALGEHVSVAVGRARLHARVLRSEQHFRALTQNSSDMISLLEIDGTIRLPESLGLANARVPAGGDDRAQRLRVRPPRGPGAGGDGLRGGSQRRQAPPDVGVQVPPQGRLVEVVGVGGSQHALRPRRREVRDQLPRRYRAETGRGGAEGERGTVQGAGREPAGGRVAPGTGRRDSV